MCFLSLFTDIRRSEELSLLKPLDDPKKKKKKEKGTESAVDDILNMDIASGLAGGIYLLRMAMMIHDDCFLWISFITMKKASTEKHLIITKNIQIYKTIKNTFVYTF